MGDIIQKNPNKNFGISLSETAGWYSKTDKKTNFTWRQPKREIPSYFLRQKMYWLQGWNWIDNPDFIGSKENE